MSCKNSNCQKGQRAWIAVFKGSVIPIAIGAIIFTGFYFIYDKYGARYKDKLDKVLISVIILYVTYWVYKITATLFTWYSANIAKKTKTDLDDKFMPLFKRIAVTLVWVIGLIILLGRLGVNISALVATLGVSSLAIALAAQDTIANVIAGFLIMIDRPFFAGDRIKLPSGEDVRVLDIGIRRSKFASQDGAVIIMPNLELSKSKITNYSMKEGDASDV